MIEEIISEEMAEAGQGQNECDTWTKAGYHCMAILGHSNKKMKRIVNVMFREGQLPHSASLAVSTLPKVDPTMGKWCDQMGFSR